MRKKDVIECLENFIEKHWRDKNLVDLPKDSDFIFKEINDVRINEESVIEEKDLKWSFNGMVKVSITDERHTVTVSNYPYILAGRAIIQPYPNNAPILPGEEIVTELPEIKKLRIITLTPQAK